jgi:hypothetical protein
MTCPTFKTGSAVSDPRAADAAVGARSKSLDLPIATSVSGLYSFIR